jgi:hypothetical protein
MWVGNSGEVINCASSVRLKKVQITYSSSALVRCLCGQSYEMVWDGVMYQRVCRISKKTILEIEGAGEWGMYGSYLVLYARAMV